MTFKSNQTVETTNCPLCGKQDYHLIFERRDLWYQVSDETFGVVRCRNCGCVFVSPRPTEYEIENYYPENFYKGDLTPAELLEHQHELLELKHEYCQDVPVGRLLDVGCATGEFMYNMKQRGWEVQGIDFTDKPPNVFDLDIHYGNLTSANYTAETFDLITLWAVLEHVYEPADMLTELYPLLKPGGMVVILVTNFNTPDAP